MARASRLQRLSWGCDLKRAAAAARLPSDPLVDVAGAHGYKHAQPQRTRQMPLASKLARWTRRVRASAGARTRGAGAPRKTKTPPWPAGPRQQPCEFHCASKAPVCPRLRGVIWQQWWRSFLRAGFSNELARPNRPRGDGLKRAGMKPVWAASISGGVGAPAPSVNSWRKGSLRPQAPSWLRLRR